MVDFIFTYGSLVNQKTWPFKLNSYRVELQGWCRKWGAIVNTKHGHFLSLTIVPIKKCKIKGLLLETNAKLDDYLSKREEAYKKIYLNNEKI